MKITKRWLKEKCACVDGMAWFLKNYSKEVTVEELVEKLINTAEKEKLKWGNWLLNKIFNREQKIRYAIFAAEQVLSFYENKYPGDKRPRLAIEAAETVLKEDTKTNRVAADDAADAAYDAAYAAAADDAYPAASAAAATASAAAAAVAAAAEAAASA